MATAIPAQIAEIFLQHQPIELGPDELVVRAGDPTDYVYWVEKGVLRQYTVSETGEELTVYLYSPGACFFMPWCFGISENLYYFESMVPAKVWRAPKIKLLELLGQDPGMLYYLLNNAFVGLSVLMIHMESQVYGNAQRKVASVLSILAKFYGRRVNGVLQLTLPLTHQLLASMVGLARETTSREVVSLKKARVIDYAGQHIKVLNESALRKIAGTYLDHIKVGVMQASD